MTDISTTVPISIRRLDPKRLGMSSLVSGKSLSALARLIGDAFSMAYVAPYTGARRHQEIASDEDFQGRDPDW